MRTRSCFLLALSLGCGYGLSADALYSVTDLGTFSVGVAINNAGQVTGSSLTATANEHAFLYSNGQMMVARRAAGCRPLHDTRPRPPSFPPARARQPVCATVCAPRRPLLCVDITRLPMTRVEEHQGGVRTARMTAATFMPLSSAAPSQSAIT
jgi:probable HAF family extracellular repeat protein